MKKLSPPHRVVTGFGADPFYPYVASRPVTRVGAHSKKALRNEVRECCPNTPGVYGMLDRAGQLIYVGKSKALRNRLLSYFSPTRSEEKAGHIIQAARVILWETQPSEFAALLREQYLIRRLTPRWNVQEIPKRQRSVYLCLARDPAYFFLAKTPPNSTIACQGPFQGASRMRRAVDSLNKFFKLRDCSNQQSFHFADQLSLFDLEHRPGCLRFEIGTCLGPCAAGCNRSDYEQQVIAAKKFLDGLDRSPLQAAEETMRLAAMKQQFELAVQAREDLRSLEYLHQKLYFLAAARQKYTFIYYVLGIDRFSIWYWIRNGEVADVLRAPKSPQGYALARSTVRQWSAGMQPERRVSEGLHPHTLSLVAKWFRKRPMELKHTFAPSQAGKKYRSLNTKQLSECG